MTRTFITGADLILPDGLASGRTVVIENERIADIVDGPRAASAGETRVDLPGHLLAPGFIDVHVHGVSGIDSLDGDGAVLAMAERLPRWGVTAFCPTSMACAPGVLDGFLYEVTRLCGKTAHHRARVLPAHLESNFINPDFRGAQPLGALRTLGPNPASDLHPHEFSGRDILAVIDRRRADVAIVTLAPEIDGGMELVRALAASGIHVSIGHSGASYDRARAAIVAGAHQATHLFNGMGPLGQRDPGMVGAILTSHDVTAELICDGHHVHPAVMRLAIAAKGTSRLMAMTDGTAGSGLPPGSRAQLGGQPITVGDVARLDTGRIAGSVLTMDRAFAYLVRQVKINLVQAAEMCAATPARALGLNDLGHITSGALADLVALTGDLDVARTWVGGVTVWEPGTPA